MNKPEISIATIITTICYDFSNKKLKNIVESLKEERVKHELISLEYKKGLFGEKEVIAINDNEFNKTIEEIRTELLEKDILTDDIILLASLLNSTSFLKNIFIKYEKDELKKKLKEIKDTEISKRVKIARYVIGSYSTIVLTM